MRPSKLALIVALACLGLLGSDLTAALPLGAPLPAGLDQHDGALRVARRRRPTRRRRQRPKPRHRPRPKPQEAAPAPAPAPEPSPGGDAIPLGPGGRSRVDFDAQMIKGQTTKAGEVQILERKDTELKSMVKRRTSFREEIILSVFPEKAGKL